MGKFAIAAVAALALAACNQGETAAATSETATETPAPEPAPAPTAKAADAAAWAKHVPWKSDGADVKKTGTGVEYVVLASGASTGLAPTAAQQAEVFYEGRLNSGGGAFDSAFERQESATFPVAAVVPGFSEALQLMRPGDRWLVFIPSALGYGAQGTPGGPIPPNADLVFEIEMVAVR